MGCVFVEASSAGLLSSRWAYGRVVVLPAFWCVLVACGVVLPWQWQAESLKLVLLAVRVFVSLHSRGIQSACGRCGVPAAFHSDDGCSDRRGAPAGCCRQSWCRVGC